MRVLVVEDNEMSRDMLSRRLERKGHEVLTAVDGREAVERAGAEAPDLILMDMSLPEVDGWEATRLLKEDPKTAPIPIIALTAHAMAGDRDRAIDAGCADYATKPLDFVRLLAKMDALGDAGSPPLLDLAAMREMAEGCGWTLAHLADSYLRSSRKELESLKAAVAGGAEAEVARLAHGWAGSTGTAGVVGMTAVLRRLEEAAREGRTAEMEGLVSKTEAQLARVKEALRDALEDG